MTAVHVTGDVHGHADKLRGLLRRCELIDDNDDWTGGDSRLWFVGDLVNHGPDGIGAIELVMRLQAQAAESGGMVDTLLGNHDVVLLGAARLGDRDAPGANRSFGDIWGESGGEANDLERLTESHVAWLCSRPLIAHEGDYLLLHADAPFYAHHGGSIAEANAAIAEILHGEDPTRWARLLEAFGEHGAFVAPVGGSDAADAFLRRFGGERIVHGHTPVSKMTGQPPETVVEPLLYAGGRCLDVDAGMYLGGPGFVYRLARGLRKPGDRERRPRVI
jgi:hypothetical protein